jgi:hypothetical protein
MNFLAAKGRDHYDLDSQAGCRQAGKAKLTQTIDRLGCSIDKNCVYRVNPANQGNKARVVFHKHPALKFQARIIAQRDWFGGRGARAHHVLEAGWHRYRLSFCSRFYGSSQGGNACLTVCLYRDAKLGTAYPADACGGLNLILRALVSKAP